MNGVPEFIARYGASPEVRVFAPARINLIGEHIDYCGGLVLPMAIHQGTEILLRRGGQGGIRIYSSRFDEALLISPEEIWSSEKYVVSNSWKDFVIGALYLNHIPASADMEILVSQDIAGGGLSSSASFCVAMGQALRWTQGAAAETSTDLQELALISRAVEQEYAGVNCGIMDQFSVTFGGILALDCRTADFRVVTPAQPLQLLGFDTQVARTLAASAYNARVQTLSGVAQQLGTAAGVSGLASVGQDCLAELPGLEQQRMRHVISEQERVGHAIEAIAEGDLNLFGRLMDASHLSLRDDYEVSCPELDIAVELLKGFKGVLGARMTGAGFGGCAIALLENQPDAGLFAELETEYESQTGLSGRAFSALISAGVRISPVQVA